MDMTYTVSEASPTVNNFFSKSFQKDSKNTNSTIRSTQVANLRCEILGKELKNPMNSVHTLPALFFP